MIHPSDISMLTRIVVGPEPHISVCLHEQNNATATNKCFVIDSANDLAQSQTATGSKIQVLWVENSIDRKELKEILKEYDYVIAAGKVRNAPDEIRRLTFNLINNRDKTIRWLIPSFTKKPLHLKLYNSRTFVGKCYASITRFLNYINLDFLLRDGQVHIYSRNYSYIERIIDRQGAKEFAAYTGIPGRNRKCIAVGQTAEKYGEDVVFFKIPLTEKAHEAVNNERETLLRLSNNSFNTFQHPWVLSAEGECAVINELDAPKELRLNTIENQHGAALKELYKYSSKAIPLRNSSFYTSIKKNLEKLSYSSNVKNDLDQGLIDEMMKQIHTIFDELDEQTEIPTGIAHGDFTPWNMKATSQKLLIYDWELASDQCPLLYDLFHFVVQTGILIKRQSAVQIREAIEDAILNTEVCSIIQEYKLDVDQHFKLYLLKIASDYLVNYSTQRYVVMQAHWLVNTFYQLLAEYKPQSVENSNRESFINSLFKQLNGKSYALLKFLGEGEVEIGKTSDIDLLVDKTLVENLIAGIKLNETVRRVKVRRKSYMTFVNIFFKDGSFLELDLIYEFKRKQTVFLKANEILENAIYNAQGIRLPQIEHQFEYIYLFYMLNGVAMSEKHREAMASLNDAGKNWIVIYLNKKYGLTISNWCELSSYNVHIHLKISGYLKHINPFSSKVMNSFLYLTDTLKDLRFKRGEIITFSGVDGAGKSTVLGDFKEVVEKKYRKSVKIIRHRPSILPILSAMKYGKKGAEERSVSKLPRSGKNKNVISSLFRFLYYFLDYTLGQWVIFFNYTMRGTTVIYDRYYFDFMVDPKRSNIKIPKLISNLCFHLIRKPTLNVFLYAEPEVILKRKQELPVEDIRELTSGYRVLFDELRKKRNISYLSVENNDLSITLNTIEKQYLRNIAA